MSSLHQLPPNLPVPVDDAAADHLTGARMPSIALRSTSGAIVDLAALGTGRTVLYCYPRTGTPDRQVPAEWDQIPGARGCTPESCGFRDHFAELAAEGASVYGVSTQDTSYQLEVAQRLRLPFDILSDADFKLTAALRLPTFDFDGVTLLRRLTMIVRDNRIEHVFYPVFPPDTHAEQVLDWLHRNTPLRERP